MSAYSCRIQFLLGALFLFVSLSVRAQRFLTLVRTIDTPAGEVHRLAFSPDGQSLVASMGPAGYTMWDVGTGRLLRAFGEKTYPQDLVISDNGNSIVGIWPSMAMILNTVDGEAIRSFSISGEGRNVDAFVARNGGTVVHVEQAMKGPHLREKFMIEAWSVRSGLKIGKRIETGENWVASAMVGDTKLGTLSRGGLLSFWDLIKGERLSRVILGGVNITDVADLCFSADGSLGYLHLLGGSTHLFDAKTGALLYSSLLPDSPAYASNQFSYDGRFLATACGSKILIWSLDGGGAPVPEPQPKVYRSTVSDIDQVVPAAGHVNQRTFAVIIANEDYAQANDVEYGLADGRSWMTYCTKTLAIPEKNLHLRTNATFGVFRQELSWLQANAKAQAGDAKLMFVFVGHGMPDGMKHMAHLLPTDGDPSMANTALPLSDVVDMLSTHPTKQIVVVLDACFSGSARSNDMLASNRGPRIRPADVPLKGNMVLLSASSGDQAAWPYHEKGHGMFTYFLLQSLQQTKGAVALGDWFEFARNGVSKEAPRSTLNAQDPTIRASDTAAPEWKRWTLTD